MNAKPELHFVRRKDGRCGLPWQRAGRQGRADRAQANVDRLAKCNELLQRPAIVGHCSKQLVCQDCACDSTATIVIHSKGNVITDNNHSYSNPLKFRSFHRVAKVDDVASVVFHHDKNAVTACLRSLFFRNSLNCCSNSTDWRRRKNFA